MNRIWGPGPPSPPSRDEATSPAPGADSTGERREKSPGPDADEASTGPPGPVPGDAASDDGAVTVEAALALCSLLVVLGLAIGAITAVGAQLRCLDAAREAARLAARGEPDRAQRAAAVLAPAGASIDVRTTGDEVEALVSASGLGGLPGLRVTGRAVGVVEPGAQSDAPSAADSAGPVEAAPDGPAAGHEPPGPGGPP